MFKSDLEGYIARAVREYCAANRTPPFTIGKRETETGAHGFSKFPVTSDQQLYELYDESYPACVLKMPRGEFAVPNPADYPGRVNDFVRDALRYMREYMWSRLQMHTPPARDIHELFSVRPLTEAEVKSLPPVTDSPIIVDKPDEPAPG